MRRRLLLAPLLGCVGTLIIGVAASQASGKPTASQLLQTAFADAAARGSVHEVEHAVSGHNWFIASDDVSLQDGLQDITRSGGIHAHVILLGPVAYVSGNHTTLVSYFGLPTSAARAVGSRWIRVPASDHGWYPTVAADATLPSALNQVKPTGPLVDLPPTELDGQSVIGIRGNMPKGFTGGGTDIVFITRSSHPLVVSATFTGHGEKVTSTFSHWGEHVAPHAPSSWIASNKL